MKRSYEAPQIEMIQRCRLEEAVTCSGGPIILPDDDFA